MYYSNSSSIFFYRNTISKIHIWHLFYVWHNKSWQFHSRFNIPWFCDYFLKAIHSEILLFSLLSEVGNDTVDWLNTVESAPHFSLLQSDNHGGDGRRSSKSELLDLYFLLKYSLFTSNFRISLFPDVNFKNKMVYCELNAQFSNKWLCLGVSRPDSRVKFRFYLCFYSAVFF